jgi:hypothetical protein
MVHSDLFSFIHEDSKNRVQLASQLSYSELFRGWLHGGHFSVFQQFTAGYWLCLVDFRWLSDVDAILSQVHTVHCLLCLRSLPVYDRYPLIDGKHLSVLLESLELQFARIVCYRSL